MQDFNILTERSLHLYKFSLILSTTQSPPGFSFSRVPFMGNARTQDFLIALKFFPLRLNQKLVQNDENDALKYKILLAKLKQVLCKYMNHISRKQPVYAQTQITSIVMSVFLRVLYLRSLPHRTSCEFGLFLCFSRVLANSFPRLTNHIVLH